MSLDEEARLSLAEVQSSFNCETTGHSHVSGDANPPHGPLQGVLVCLPRDAFLFHNGHPLHSQSVLFVGEVPSLGGDRKTWPVGITKEGDWQGDLSRNEVSKTRRSQSRDRIEK